MASNKKRTGEEHVDELALLSRAHTALGITGTDLAKLLGMSRRTISRWYGRRTSIGSMALGQLAPHVYAHDPALAERMHAYVAERMASLRLPPPPPLPVPQPAVRPASTDEPPSAVTAASQQLRVDAVVFAACDAMDAAPRAARVGLAAAVRRARELGVSLEEIERALSTPAKTRKT
jgi:hypothetical protein